MHVVIVGYWLPSGEAPAGAPAPGPPAPPAGAAGTGATGAGATGATGATGAAGAGTGGTLAGGFAGAGAGAGPWARSSRCAGTEVGVDVVNNDEISVGEETSVD